MSIPEPAQVEFGELPPAPNPLRGGKWASIAAALREHPQSWAKVNSAANTASARTQASNIRRGRRTKAMPAGDFEAAVRPGENGFDIWARYVGEQS